jgi:hypothetical protein
MKRTLSISVALVGLCVIAGYAGPNGPKDEGVGTYSDVSVGNQISNFTINRQMVSCGVGTFSSPPGTTGPFAMLMYATNIFQYRADHQTNIITAWGRMRSITHISGNEVEDVEHNFLAIAQDNGAVNDRFDIHFRTCFWNGPAPGPGTCLPNPSCTPSDQIEDGCRFGGVLVTDSTGLQQMGDITVGP